LLLIIKAVVVDVGTVLKDTHSLGSTTTTASPLGVHGMHILLLDPLGDVEVVDLFEV